MTTLVHVFADNLLPILLTAAVGFVLARSVGLEARPLGTLTFNALGPSLVFHTIVHSDVRAADFARMGGFALATLLVPALAAAGIGRVLRLDRALATSLVLTVLLSNAGNYGLSVVTLAFDDAAFTQATIFFAVAVAVTWTLGVVVASLGTADLATALRGVLRVPPLYAVSAALVFKSQGWLLPPALDRPVGLLAQAAIPVMLVLLGAQLYHNRDVGDSRCVPLAVGLRLVAAPALALALVPLLGLGEPARQAGLVQAAMPTAVVSTVLAETYGLDAAFVTRVVVLSTVLSPLTLTPLLAWLGA
ncbi:hypothetical protein DCC79_06910 [bacterium]|nr:AEC family transporter [Chloroflexi bacterium CFX6]RIL10803.1 MAG: hypothetical protein DCC79_06910 [bacterium]